MASFTLRKIEPAFWLRVQAKAAADGIRVRDLILRLLTAWLAACVLLSVVGCAYHAPVEPTPVTTTVAASAPFTLSLGAAVGFGTDAGRATVTAKVQNVNGAPLGNIVVAFATDLGTLSATNVTTAPDGTASTTITASDSATITATAGTLTTKTLVASQPPVAAAPTPTAPVPTPGAPSPGPLSVTLTATDVTLGTQTLFSANVKNGPAVSFAWAFGDGTTATGTSTSTAHTYTVAGTGVANVTVTDALGARASAATTITVNPLPPPPPPAPAPGPSYTVTLAASSTTVVAGGSSTLTATVVRANGSAAPTGFAWDCDGDGTAEAPTSATTKVCTYPTAVSTVSKVTVTGPDSATGSATVTIAVTVPPPPTVTINCSTGAKANVVASTCVASATVNGVVVSGSDIGPVDWNFGDASVTATATSLGNTSPSHQYTTANTFTVTAKATIVGVTGKVNASTTTVVAP